MDYIILSYDLGYINDEAYNELKDMSEHASRMINSYCEGVIKNTALKENEL